MKGSKRTASLLDIASSAFGNGQRLPPEYTQDGADLSPPLNWSELPSKARSVAIICDDPDAPTARPFVHWLIWDIPVATTGLPLTGVPEGVAKSVHPPDLPGAAQGFNDFGATGYAGPAPPHGSGLHSYHFKIHALDRLLELSERATKQELLDAMKGHVVGYGEIIGTYSR